MMTADAPSTTDTPGIDGIFGEDDGGASGVTGSTPGELLGSEVGTLHIFYQYLLVGSLVKGNSDNYECILYDCSC